jgi:hypothetical protein
MKSTRRRFALTVALATLGLVIALGLHPTSTERILAVYALALAGLGMLALTRAADGADEFPPESLFEQWLSTPAEVNVRPPELVRTERDITLGSSNAGHLHRRLLPLLREAAAVRLASHHHVDLERRPEEARRLLGDEAWQLLRPDRPEPADRNAKGMSLHGIGELVGTLERL